MNRGLITGGAGFIGSHLAEELLARGWAVRVLDNLSTGSMENVLHLESNARFDFRNGYCQSIKDVQDAMKECDVVFHLAANREVRTGLTNTRVDLEQNVIATHNVLECMRRSETAKTLVFSSTSTVYGDAIIIPTPEDYGPLEPISLYGASKLACEALISAFCHMFALRAIIYRFANVVGARCNHGVVYDFIRKLKKNPKELEILGDGRQSKSYLLVDDCVEAFLFGLEHSEDLLKVYNVGSEDRINVTTIARVVVEEMGLRDVNFHYSGGVNGGRGWKGDVKEMLLDVSKLKGLGWKPRHNSLESIRSTTRSLIVHE
jgi:UDP-glucose 4-epimerase